MSKRGLSLFDEYVARCRGDPRPQTYRPEGHSVRLQILAEVAGMPISEIIEEVGPLGDALAVALDGHASRATHAS